MSRIQLRDPRPLRWNKQAFRRLPELFHADGLRLELIDGEVIEMPPMNEPHALALTLVQETLRRAFGPGYTYRQQMPLDLSGPHEPEPDLAIIRGEPRSITAHPASAELVV
jgi:Uma2 family endonuclease